MSRTTDCMVCCTAQAKEVADMLEKIKWLGHASFKILGERVIYIDPWKLKGGEPADLVLITHSHSDHCSAKDVRKIRKEDTIIAAPPDCRSELSGDLQTVAPGDSLTIQGIPIEVVPAYNVGKAFHPKANGWVGFIVTVDGMRIYHAGDTDLIPEMDHIRADIALLPIGGTYTMNASEVAQAAIKIGPKVAIPMHWGDIVGSKKDAKKFQDLCKGKVEVLKPA